MRHIILLIFSLIVTEISAQQVLFYRNDGTRVKLHISELDSIRFMDDDWVDPTGEPNRLPMKVIATFKGDNTANRIGMHRLHMGDADGSNDKTMLWQEDDQISLFQGTENNLFELRAGVGTREGTFSGIGTTGNATAIYPYRANMKFKDGTVSELILPTIQKASDGNCDPKAALMMGQTFVNNEEQSNNIETKIGFQNICSYLVIIPEQDLDRVIVTSRNVTDCLSGNVSVKYENGVPTLTATQNAFTSNKVTLQALQGPLKAGNTYYIAVLPGTLASGFVVTSYVSGCEKTITKQLTSSATFVRSKYHNCSSFTKGDGEGFVVDLDLEGENVHRYWSTRNIGASTPQDHGDYFAWGEVTPVNSYGENRLGHIELKDVCTWKNYKHGDGGEHETYNNNTFVQKYGGSFPSGDDNKRELESDDDAAHVIWGGEYEYWKMPSKADFDALLSQCKYEYIADYHNSGIRGYVFYNKNYTEEKGFTDDHVIDVIQSQESADYGKEITHIFLPFGGYYDNTVVNPYSTHGYYWSSTVEENNQYNYARAHDLVMTSSESEGNVKTSVEAGDHADFRRGGQNIRPIYNRTFTDSTADQEAKAKIVLPVILPTATE